MKKIKHIIRVVKKMNEGKPYHVTYAMFEDGLEGQAWGNDYEVGEPVRVWYDEEYDKTKFAKKGDT